MGLPLQNIPEKDKTREWAQRCVFSIIEMVGNTNLSKQKDRFCYDLYNGIFNESDYDYLRKVDKYEYPAKIRFIPLIRPKLDRLRSEETKRPFVFRVFTVDKASIEKKESSKARAIVNLIYSRITARNLELQELYESYNQQQAELDKFVGEQKATAEQQAIVKQLKKQIEILKQPLSSETVISKAELDKIDAYYRQSYRDWQEIIAEKGIHYLVQHYDLKSMFNEGFEDELVTDKEFYYADYHPGDNDPVVRRVTPLNFYYSSDDECQWVQDCEWAMEERWLTLPQIVDEFKADLSTEDMENLKRSYTFYSSNNYNYDYPGYQFSNERDYDTENCNGLYGGTVDYGNKIRVCHCVWKSVRQIKFKKSPNKHIEGSFYTKWIEDNKEDQDAKIDKLRKGQEYEIAYVNDVWEGIMVDRNIYIRLQKRPVQLRTFDQYGKVDLPFIGRAYNGINRRAYSIVWAAKDIQILYNLIHYHKELWLALSGVKGFIMDKSQLPDGMSQEEWIYQRKIGQGWIQTVREGINRQPTFNQFQHYDDTITPAIQYLTLILQHLEDLAGSVTGISRQSQGAITNKDLKGTTEQAITQSSMVTEIIFHKHDMTKKKVLERLINLCRIAWKDGKRGQYVLGDMAQEILNIQPGQLTSADYEVWMDDNGKQQRAINEIRQLAFAEHSKGMITLPQIVSLYNIDNLKELERMLEKYGEIADRKIAGQKQSEAEAEANKIQMEQEFKKAIEREKNNISAMAVKIDQLRLDFEKEKFSKEEKFKEKELSSKMQMDKYKVDSERGVEMQYLVEQKRQTNLDFRLKTLELGMESIKESIDKIGGGNKPKEKVKD
jgi:hypothetical protein